MDSYLDIKALPNPEIIQSAVVAALMQSLHRMLPAYDGRIGVGFPAYGQQRTLGGIIRVFGAKEDIESLHANLNEDSNVANYALVMPLAVIPMNITKFASYKRYHVQGQSRLRRQQKRHEERGTWNQAIEQAMNEKLSETVNLPHISLSSSSTGQRFILFVKRQIKKTSADGKFNAYGLSLFDATIPMF